METTYGNVTIKGVKVYYRGREPYIASTDVKEQLDVVSWEPLYNRDLKYINRDENKTFLDYFHSVSGCSRNINLYNLRELNGVEGRKKFKGIFKKKEHFFKILNGYYEYLESEIEDSQSFLREVEYLSSESTSNEVEIVQPPRKNRENSPDAVSLLQSKIDEWNDDMFRQLAIERALNDPEVQNAAVKRAADDFMRTNGKVIRDAADAEHKKHVATLKATYAAIDQREKESLEGARRSRQHTETQERDRLKRVREEITSAQKSLSTIEDKTRAARDKLRKLEADAEELKRKADAQAQSYGSFRPRAQKGPMVASYMSQMYNK